MDCCNNNTSGKKRTWLMPLIFVVIAGALLVYRQFNLATVAPLVMIILCPLIHGAMFFFMAKGKKDTQQPPSA